MDTWKFPIQIPGEIYNEISFKCLDKFLQRPFEEHLIKLFENFRKCWGNCMENCTGIRNKFIIQIFQFWVRSTWVSDYQCHREFMTRQKELKLLEYLTKKRCSETPDNLLFFSIDPLLPKIQEVLMLEFLNSENVSLKLTYWYVFNL